LKKALCLIVSLLVLLSVTVSCGIPKDVYEKATNDLTARAVELSALNEKYNTLNSQLTVLNEQLTAKNNDLLAANDKYSILSGNWTLLQAEFDELNDTYEKASGDLTEANSGLTIANGDLSKANSDLTAVNAKMEKLGHEIVVLNALFIPAITGQIKSMTPQEADEMEKIMESNIEAIGDPTLSAKYIAMKYGGTNTQFASDFYEYLLTDMEKQTN
jgi:chromosome segregation ATPase